MNFWRILETCLLIFDRQVLSPLIPHSGLLRRAQREWPACLRCSQDVCHLMKFLGHLHTRSLVTLRMPSFFLMLSNVAPYAHCSYMPFRSIEILTCIAVSPFWPLVTRISTIKGARFRRQKVKVPSDNNAGKEDERTRSDRKMTRYDKWSSSEDKFAGKGMERGHNSWQQGRIRETRIKTKRMTRRKSRRKIRRETTKDKAWMVDAACSSTKKTHMENHWEHQNRIYLEEKDMFFNRYSDSKHNLTRCKTHIDSKTFQHIPAYSKIFQHMGIGQNLGYPKN